MTIDEYAEHSGTHRGTVARRINRGMPARKKFISGLRFRWEIDPAKADEWLKNQKGESENDHRD